MSRFRIIGMDWFDVVVHIGVTITIAVAASMIFNGQDRDLAASAVLGGSLLLLGIRRKKALAELPDTPADRQRVEELELRVADLEQVQCRVAELEERADFAERLLARGRDEAAAGLPEGRR